jgi:hypothetical protein
MAKPRDWIKGTIVNVIDIRPNTLLIKYLRHSHGRVVLVLY